MRAKNWLIKLFGSNSQSICMAKSAKVFHQVWKYLTKNANGMAKKSSRVYFFQADATKFQVISIQLENFGHYQQKTNSNLISRLFAPQAIIKRFSNSFKHKPSLTTIS